ncbi:MAG: hypothetical protein FJW40_03325 [Acidobacteria bacterium]|nr:hypothetical protein [Acidobacteriota bacterium]
MARGWESKSVESQIEERVQARRDAAATKPTAEAIANQARRQSLELTRTRVANDRAMARHPRHQAQLDEALKHLDAQLAGLP